jgi:hypothetical protein
MLDKLPTDILIVIIKNQQEMKDINPAIMCKQYQVAYDIYIAKQTQWLAE